MTISPPLPPCGRLSPRNNGGRLICSFARVVEKTVSYFFAECLSDGEYIFVTTA